MTIRLPEDLGRSILDEVRSGRFASVDDAVAEAVRAYLRGGTRADAFNRPGGGHRGP